MSGLYDSFLRPINYLRISVTDRCNLRCIYCMPEKGIQPFPRDILLTYEEIYLITQAAAELGINKVRITGGEPLVRTHLKKLIALISQIPGIDDISLTTNGALLSQQAEELKKAGLKRVNVSLDSLRPERYREITRRGRLEDVLQGIAKAKEVGLEPLKINTVVMRGINDDELLDFCRLTIEEGWHVRFIELMPFEGQEDWFISIPEMWQRIRSLGELEPYPLSGNGPAKYYRLPGAKGTIGFIGPVSEHICFRCNRLRLTAEGKLRPCLLSDEEIDLREQVRRGASLEEIKELIRRAVASKPIGHRLRRQPGDIKRSMCQIGG
ncbi:MAG: GTP 3',8-cyclase MoaA [Chloroflexi bacterium]|nr:MAG: GTP 3',8-cyclase MoaA [Chloroflexota bacterium]